VSSREVNFDPVARPYRWIEYVTFGPWLARCRTAQLAKMKDARRALVLGDGDGRFLSRLLTANPDVTVDVVDSSAGMLTLLDRRILRSGVQARERICLHHSDALAWEPAGSYDLIVSHFFLDCFFSSQIEQLFDRVVPHAVPGAKWLISEFAVPRNRLTAPIARGIVAFLYRAFGCLTGLSVRALPDYAAALSCRGMSIVHHQQFLFGLLSSEVWTLPPATQ